MPPMDNEWEFPKNNEDHLIQKDFYLDQDINHFIEGILYSYRRLTDLYIWRISSAVI